MKKKMKKMPDGGKVKKGGVPILPYGVRPNPSNDTDQWNAAVNNQLLTGIQPRQNGGISKSAKFLDIEQGAYDRYDSKPQKSYPDDSPRVGKLTQGKLRGANPSAEMIQDLVSSADRYGVDRNTMLGLAANESMFGIGYRGGGRREGDSKRGVLQQNVISSWDMDNEYRPVPAAQFAYGKGVPGIELTKDKQGYMYGIKDKEQYMRSLDSALTVHPEWMDQYRNANSGVTPRGDINYFDQTADALKKTGLSSSRFNPGDPDYANKVNNASQLVANDPVLQQFYKNYDNKTKGSMGSMKNGGSINMQSVTERLNGIPLAKNGISINPKNKGKFTSSASKAGMSVQEFADHVMKNKSKYSATQVKRANFARNAAKWHKAEFGVDMPYYAEPYQEDPRLGTAKKKITDYFQNNPDEGWVPNDATMQGADPDQAQYLTDEEGNIKQSSYDPTSGDSRTTANVKNVGQGIPNIHLNAGVAITALAGFATKGLKKAQEIDEFSRLKRRQLTGQTYNPNAYGTGSQAIMKMGGSISSKYQLTPEQAQFLKKQGYNI